MIEFPISGVEVYWWFPLIVAFIVSCLASVGGLSGAFMLLPFQISILGFTAPGVSPTNLFFNIIAIPSGVYRFSREKRMLWPLVWVMTAGSLPGLLLGVIIRVKYLPDPANFKLFAGLVLLYLGVKLLRDILKKNNRQSAIKINKNFADFIVSDIHFNFKSISYKFDRKEYSLPNLPIFFLSILIGIIGGIYGIGGGAFLVPILVTIYGLPIYSISGAALAGTFLASVVGVLFYTVIAPAFSTSGSSAGPDWMLGLLLGLGGMLGIYVGALLQRFMPIKIIKIILMLCLTLIAIKYIMNFFI